MTTTTPRGLPIPQDSDPLIDVAKWTADLANALDQRLPQSGGLAVSVTAGTTVSQRVTFPRPYPAGTIPDVVASLHAASPKDRGVSVSAIDSLGFTINVYGATTVSLPVKWMATWPA